MNRAKSPLVSSHRMLRLTRVTWLGLFVTGLFLLPAIADEKEGMPDLAQIDQTCLPTSTANLIIWFGLHGYPKLIVPGDNRQDGYIHTVRRLMAATDANYDWGTRPDKIADGIKKYIEEAGYDGDTEFRGLGMKPFTADWLKENDDPNKGFILLLAYCAHDQNTDTFTNAWNAGHAVTLVNAMPDMLLVHDPAHYEDETGRKILTPEVLTGGTWRSREGNMPVAGLMLVSGSLLDTPPNAGVMLIGAVCVTMHSSSDKIASSTFGVAGGPNSTIAGGPASAPSTPAAPVSATKGWVQWIFNLLFSK